MACCLLDDLYDAHHPFVLVIDRVAVVDKAYHNHWIGKRDDHLQDARAVIRRGQHRDRVPQAVLVLTDPVDLRYQEARLVDVKL